MEGRSVVGCREAWIPSRHRSRAWSGYGSPRRWYEGLRSTMWQLRRRTGRRRSTCPHSARRADQALPGRERRGEEAGERLWRSSSRMRARVASSARAWKGCSHAAGCHPGTQAQPRVLDRIFAHHARVRVRAWAWQVLPITDCGRRCRAIFTCRVNATCTAGLILPLRADHHLPRADARAQGREA